MIHMYVKFLLLNKYSGNKRGCMFTSEVIVVSLCFPLGWIIKKCCQITDDSAANTRAHTGTALENASQLAALEKVLGKEPSSSNKWEIESPGLTGSVLSLFVCLNYALLNNWLHGEGSWRKPGVTFYKAASRPILGKMVWPQTAQLTSSTRTPSARLIRRVRMGWICYIYDYLDI